MNNNFTSHGNNITAEGFSHLALRSECEKRNLCKKQQRRPNPFHWRKYTEQPLYISPPVLLYVYDMCMICIRSFEMCKLHIR